MMQYGPMNAGPPQIATGGGMGKGGGRQGGAPGMGGKGGGMRPPAPMGTLPDRFRGGPMGAEVNLAGPPMRPPAMNDYLPGQGAVLPPPPNRGFVPPLNPNMATALDMGSLLGMVAPMTPGGGS